MGKTGIRPSSGGTRWSDAALRLLTALLLATVAGCAVAGAAAAANPVQLENGLPGDGAWEAAVSAHVNFLHPPLAGYASATSVRPGGTIEFSVNVPRAARYRVEISRLGWYGGAGGRRLGCLVGSLLDPTCTRDEAGVQQPAVPAPDPLTGEVRAGWAVTDHLQIPADWVSGYYLAVFKLTTGAGAGQTGFAPFIVPAPAGDRSRILVEVPTNTWQAYNAFGGEDVYTTPQAAKVSFDRPYQHHHLFRWEYPLVRFLERGGYDVSYATDDDVDRDPAILLGHRLDVAAGHGEYWTKAIRDGWEAARSHGVNLAFTGANTGYWQVRYEDAYRTMVSYKSKRDPEADRALKTVEFRHLEPRRPECELLGEQSSQKESETGQYFDYSITKAAAADAWFAGSGLRAGDAIPGIVGFELDSRAVAPSCHVAPVTVLLRFRGHADDLGRPLLTADAVRYRACSGSEVFDAGSLFFSWGLDPWRDPEFSPPLWPQPPGASPALQRVMANALADMQVPHPRFRAAGAVRLLRHGTELRIDPGVGGGLVSVDGSAVVPSADGRLVSLRVGGVRGRGAATWRPRLPRGALAVLLTATARTGDVRESRRYIELTDGHGRFQGRAGPLSAASCYGARAAVLNGTFGGPGSRVLRLAVQMPRPFTLKVFHGRRQVALVRVRRGRRAPVVLRVPAGRVPCGRASILLAARGQKLRLAAFKACSEHRQATAPARGSPPPRP